MQKLGAKIIAHLANGFESWKERLARAASVVDVVTSGFSHSDKVGYYVHVCLPKCISEPFFALYGGEIYIGNF